MKRLSLIATLLLAVLILQKCKKDTVSASAMSNTLLFAVVNDTVWNADTVHAAITYNLATKTKVFTCAAIGNNKGVSWSVTQTTNALNTAGFPINIAFNADAAGNNTFIFNTTQRNMAGNLALAPLGSVAPGSGTLNISSIDSTKMTITGTFSFTAVKDNPDNSVTISQIAAGAFNNLPYTFVSN